MPHPCEFNARGKPCRLPDGHCDCPCAACRHSQHLAYEAVKREALDLPRRISSSPLSQQETEPAPGVTLGSAQPPAPPRPSLAAVLQAMRAQTEATREQTRAIQEVTKEIRAMRGETQGIRATLWDTIQTILRMRTG